MTRIVERRLARIELQQDEARQIRKADAARYAHLSRAQLERMVMDEMTDYLVARSFPARTGTISAEAVAHARLAFRHHPPCLAVIEAVLIHQENTHAPH